LTSTTQNQEKNKNTFHQKNTRFLAIYLNIDYFQ
jgi:hypothetical protein